MKKVLNLKKKLEKVEALAHNLNEFTEFYDFLGFKTAKIPLLDPDPQHCRIRGLYSAYGIVGTVPVWNVLRMLRYVPGCTIP